ncbi:hypothetical protein ACI6QG_14315 [Roseococcus sp. DSY-14]|uniref:hypothetical protein n=1 Tax=Roseococcus sp. DSY-14 TaxID=3369650 RepID=UPI00387B3C89
MRQGYIVLATGDAKYTAMAVNLAASLRVTDPGRGVCLVCDRGQEPRGPEAALFEHVVGITGDTRFPHVMNKIRVFDLSPYDSTMFVDADCLLAKDDVDSWWRACETRPFSVTGGAKRAGEWKGVEVSELLRAQGQDYLIQMNAGVFHFTRTPEGRAFFAGLEAFYLDKMEELSVTNYKGPNSQSFELYLGLYMGRLGMDCANVANRGEDSWMVSTWRALWFDIAPERGRCTIWKGARHLWGLPFLPRQVDRLSPTFPHFVALKPRRLYDRLAAYYRHRAGLG